MREHFHGTGLVEYFCVIWNMKCRMWKFQNKRNRLFTISYFTFHTEKKMWTYTIQWKNLYNWYFCFYDIKIYVFQRFAVVLVAWTKPNRRNSFIFFSEWNFFISILSRVRQFRKCCFFSPSLYNKWYKWVNTTLYFPQTNYNTMERINNKNTRWKIKIENVFWRVFGEKQIIITCVLMSRTSSIKDCCKPPLNPSKQRIPSDVIEIFVIVQLCTWSGRPKTKHLLN